MLTEENHSTRAEKFQTRLSSFEEAGELLPWESAVELTLEPVTGTSKVRQQDSIFIVCAAATTGGGCDAVGSAALLIETVIL